MRKYNKLPKIQYKENWALQYQNNQLTHLNINFQAKIPKLILSKVKSLILVDIFLVETTKIMNNKSKPILSKNDHKDKLSK